MKPDKQWLQRAAALVVLSVSLQAQQRQLSIHLRQNKELVVEASGLALGAHVEFFDGFHPFGTAAVDENGAVRIPSASLAPGKHSIRAVARGTGQRLAVAPIAIDARAADRFESTQHKLNRKGISTIAAAPLEDATRLSLVTLSPGALHIGQLTERIPTLDDATALAIADFDGDGRQDVAVAGASGSLAMHLNGRAMTRLNAAAGAHPIAMTAADLNNDGIADLAIANRDTDDVTVLIGAGDGTFSPAAFLKTGNSPRGLAVLDWNSDGIADILTLNAQSRDIRIHLGLGDGTFRAGGGAPAGDSPVAYAMADWNEDGAADIAVWDETARLVRAFVRSGDGMREVFTREAAAIHLAAADINGDGHADIAITTADGIQLLAGKGDGSFSDASLIAAKALAGPAALADLDHDGRLEFAATTANGDLTIIRAATCADVGSLVFTQQPLNPSTQNIATTGRPIIVQVLDGNGQPLTSCRATVTVDVGNPPSNIDSFTGIPTFTAAAREVRDADATGKATFTTLMGPSTTIWNNSVLTAKAGTITATSIPFNIVPGATTSLVFTKQPTSGTITTSPRNNFTAEVEVSQRDSNGNPSTANNNTQVTFTKDSGPNDISGTTTVTQLSSIARSPGITFTSAGTYRIKASGVGGVEGLSAPIVITYSSPVVEFTTKPAGVAVGSALAPVSVRVVDVNGNPVTAATTVTMSVVSGSFTSASTTTAVTGTGGVATFSNLVLTTAGTYSLRASATGAAAGVSDPFTVTAGPASRITISSQPAFVVAGSPFSIVAQVVDSYGNPTSSTALVSLAFSPATVTGSANAAAGMATVSNIVIPNSGTYTPTLSSSSGLQSVTGTAITVGAAPPLVSVSSITVPDTTGTGTLLVTAIPSASWSMSSSSNTWLQVASPNGTVTGSGVASFTYTANSGAARSATLTIGGLTVTVNQLAQNSNTGAVIAAGPVSGLNVPRGLAVSSDGVLVADTVSSAVRKWNPSTGQLSLLARNGVSFPLGVTTDPRGNIYIADTGSGSVKMLSASDLLAAPITLISGLSHPSSIACDWKGDIYIADTFDQSIKVWTAATQKVTAVASGLSEPAAVVSDGVGNIYFSELGPGTVKKFALATRTSTTLPGTYKEPHGLAVDGRGNVYIAEAGTGQVHRYDAGSGQVAMRASGFASPVGLAADAAGNVYIADAADISQRPAGATQFTGSIRTVLALGASVTQPASSGGGSLKVDAATGATSDQSWLTITSTANGVITYTVTANTTGAARTARITANGQVISIVQPSGGVAAPAKTISIDFTGNGSAMQTTELAGVVSKANWNNAPGAVSASALTLRDEDGALTTATVSWKSANPWAIPYADVPGNLRMMRGYLDNGDEAPITVTVNNLPPSANGYDIYVYSDGDNQTQRKEGVFSIDGGPGVFCSDASSVNFGGTFTKCADGPGNYAVLSTAATSFTLTATPLSTQGSYRAPVNGIQIVPRTSPIPATPARALAKAIGINFVGRSLPMLPGEVAGLVQKSNWNNAGQAASAQPLKLRDENGALTNATLTWKGANPWSLPIADASGNTRLMQGYLDNGDAKPITVSITGLDAAPRGYDVYLYKDGDNANSDMDGTYALNGTPVTCRDPRGVNFNGTFDNCSDGAGNYILFSNVTGPNLSFTATPTPGLRSPINAIQIVPRP